MQDFTLYCFVAFSTYRVLMHFALAHFIMPLYLYQPNRLYLINQLVTLNKALFTLVSALVLVVFYFCTLFNLKIANFTLGFVTWHFIRPLIGP